MNSILPAICGGITFILVFVVIRLLVGSSDSNSQVDSNDLAGSITGGYDGEDVSSRY